MVASPSAEMPSLTKTFFNRQEQNFDIQPKAEVVDVPNIVGELFVP